MSDNQLERISAMERRLDAIESTTANLAEALDEYIALQEDIESLDRYYGSREWQRDFADDSEGKLPHDLKRGVLSEDAAWNVLIDVREMNKRIADFAQALPRK